ncbi:hypothetical protein ACIQPQ_31045 [Streptomyces sp. NPDC091281]|uniref:hypothetical protein n=1 Tax=Streptomyces sp. NPDC091281 TaxID=3365985 RepID=UPI0038217AAF
MRTFNLGGFMRVRATVAATALLLAALTACGNGGDSGDTEQSVASKPAAADTKAVDCSDESLSQSEWTENCAEQGTGGDGTDGEATGLKFGGSYTWPDGLKVSVVEARVFTDFDPEVLESPEPGQTEFRVKLKLENTGKSPAALDDLSMIIEGATNGGEAALTEFSRGSAPLQGRLAPGVTAVKTGDHVLETRYGKRIVVTVQRASEDFDLDFPEFEGEIVG